MKLSIIIPAHNEEARISHTLDVYTEFFIKHYGDDVELIVVVNYSTDTTEQVTRAYCEKCPQVKCIVEPLCVGKGGAIRIGSKVATGQLVGFVDADASTPPDAYQDLVDHIGSADAIIASRWIEGAVVSPRQPLARRIASRIFNFLVRTLFGLKITDTQCGAKLMTKEAMDTVIPLLSITKWAFDVDVLFQLRRAGFEIIERPTTWHDAGGSRLNVPKASLEMFVAICRLRLLFSPFRWVVTVYDKTIGKFIPVNV